MADILQDFTINASPEKVFSGIASPEGLNQWWTKKCAGHPTLTSIYHLGFGPGYDWAAVVTKCLPDKEFELKLTHADEQWNGTIVKFTLESIPKGTRIRFSHSGWPEVSENFRVSTYCWAMYLRILKRYLEFGEVVAYEDRLRA